MTTEPDPFIGPIRLADASWSISLDVECPLCYHDFDILGLGPYSEILGKVEIGESGRLIEVQCPKCKREFDCETSY